MCRVTSRAAESRNLGIELWIQPSEKVLVQGKNWVVCNNSPLILSQANPSGFHWNLVKTHIAEKGRGCNLKQEPRGCWKCGILSWQQLLLWAVGLFLITPSFYSSTASPKLFSPSLIAISAIKLIKYNREKIEHSSDSCQISECSLWAFCL